jgi:hypothetical protein
MTEPELTEPELGPATDVAADPEHLDTPHAPFTTDEEQLEDDLDPNEGEGGAG